ncbi:hypothetical protein ACWEKM_27055 [Streptomyces sp. NPDC004752]
MASSFQNTVFPTLRPPSGDIPADASRWNPQRPSTRPHHRHRPAHQRVDLPWGAGRDTSVLTASVPAVMAAANRTGRAAS